MDYLLSYSQDHRHLKIILLILNENVIQLRQNNRRGWLW